MLAKDCIFCKIASGKLKTEAVLETKRVIAFFDVNPVAKTHILIVPKKHIESVLTIDFGDCGEIVEMFKVAARIIKDKNIEAFRLAFNGGIYQHVPHLHMHLLAGSAVEWSKL